jgi:hypothetical protein
MGGEIIEVIRLSFFGGLTFLYADGGILRGDVSVEANAFGAGPTFVVRCDPLRLGPVGVGVVAMGGVLLFTETFPPGATVYEFAWRLGPSVTVDLDDRLTIAAGFRWLHVSNGLIDADRNPAYENWGVSASLLFHFAEPR